MDQGLVNLFATQDAAIKENLSFAPQEFSLLNRGLVLGLNITMCLNDLPGVSMRKTKNQTQQESDTIIINLLHAGWSALVNATRLSLFGAHCDAIALIRHAFEASYYAEFFIGNPDAALVWNKAGQIIDAKKRRKFQEKFENKYQVKNTLKEKYRIKGLDPTPIDRILNETSSFGIHINPFTVAFRLQRTTSTQCNNMGFMSTGKKEATRLCAVWCGSIAAYILSEYWEGYGEYLESFPPINDTYKAFLQEYESLQASVPSELSLLR
jgi:hypothetical protein